jgi:hypothetical protein
MNPMIQGVTQSAPARLTGTILWLSPGRLLATGVLLLILLVGVRVWRRRRLRDDSNSAA